MAMYHSWDSQNAWLRQIHTHNYLFVNPRTAQAAGIADGGWMWVESPWGKVRCMCRYSEAVEPGTVWTWNAIGKAAGAWHLEPDANESQRGFLLNHLISEELPAAGGGSAAVELRPDHRPGRLVRRARAHLHGRGRRAGARPGRSSSAMQAVPGMPARAEAARLDGRGRMQGGSAMTQLALVIDLNVCVGCHACVTSCKQWNTSGSAGPLADDRPLRRRPDRHLLQPRADLRGRRVPEHADGALPQELPALRRPALRAGVPHRRQLQARRGRHRAGRLRQVHRLQVLRWACPYGARELDEERKVMTKCTLCVDRIYDKALPEAERKPACVLACPTNARLFGDIHDPESVVSRGHPRARRLPADARVGHAARPTTTCRAARTQITLHAEDLQRVDNPLKIDGQQPEPAHRAPAREDFAT